MALALYSIVDYIFIKKNNRCSSRSFQGYTAIFAFIFFMSLRGKVGAWFFGIPNSNLAMLIFATVMGFFMTMGMDKIENDTKVSIYAFKTKIMLMIALMWLNLVSARSFIILIGAITVWPLYVAYIGNKWFIDKDGDNDKAFLAVVAVIAMYTMVTNSIAQTLTVEGQQIVISICIVMTVGLCFIGRDKLFKLMCMINIIISMLANIPIDVVDCQLIALIVGVVFCITLAYKFSYVKLILLVITIINMAINIDVLGNMLGIK